MSKIVIYTTRICPYCIRAKQLLQRKNAAFEEISVDRDEASMQTMMELSGRRTVPQIFIDDLHVGGYEDLAALDACGELDPLL